MRHGGDCGRVVDAPYLVRLRSGRKFHEPPAFAKAMAGKRIPDSRFRQFPIPFLILRRPIAWYILQTLEFTHFLTVKEHLTPMNKG